MDLDKLIMEEFVQFREKIVDSVQSSHPHMFMAINTILSNKKNKIGLQVIEEGKAIGEYTFILNGVRVASVDKGRLLSEIHHPVLGVIRPYVVAERIHLEKMMKEQGFLNDLLATIPKYLPGLTIKFM